MKIMNYSGTELYKKFSFPYRFGDMPSLAWFKDHKELIYDVYINPDIFGLTMQAMNGTDADDDRDTIKFLQDLSSIGIKICCTLNNIFNPISIKDFLESNKEYLELIDILVVPDSSWLTLKDQYEIRSSVILDPSLNDLNDPIWKEFNCVYIHGDNLRNVKKYSRFKNLGAVVNFNDCVSWCSIKNSHYREINKEKFSCDGFCPTKKMQPNERQLAVTRIPPFLSEYIFYSTELKIFKLQGRGTTDTFYDAVSIIENIKLGREELTPSAKKIKELLPGIELYRWIHKIRNQKENNESSR